MTKDTEGETYWVFINDLSDEEIESRICDSYIDGHGWNGNDTLRSLKPWLEMDFADGGQRVTIVDSD